MTELTTPPAAPVAAARGLRGVVDRFEGLIREVGKFGVVGLVTFVIDVGIFNGLTLTGWQEPVSRGALSMTVAATVAFFGNRFWTWRDRERSRLHREYTLYFLFNLVGLAVSTYGLGAVWPWFTGRLAQNIAKNVVGMALGTAFRFWSYRQYVFRHPPKETAAGSLP